jgi:ankyrin repeat protein
VLQNGWTPLYSASSFGHVEVVGALLAKGADVEAQTKVSLRDVEAQTKYPTLTWRRRIM